jgi:hypothetical protein
MAQAVKSALPQHLLKPNGKEDEFAPRHHGKTRSHMVSSTPVQRVILSLSLPA